MSINRLTITGTTAKPQPKFGAGDCKYGTVGKNTDGELYIWTSTGDAVNLQTGQIASTLKGITPLVPFTSVTLSANEEQ